MVDETVANPIAPVQCGVAKRRSEHIAADHADANPPRRESSLLEFIAKLAEEHRDGLALQIPPGLTIEFVTHDIDAVPRTEIRTHGFIETKLIAVLGRP